MEILSQYIIYSISPFLMPLGIASITSIVLLMAFASTKRLSLTFFLIALSIFCISAFFYEATIGRVKENHYKITFHEPIIVNDFLDKYDILEIDGHILTVKEKTPDE